MSDCVGMRFFFIFFVTYLIIVRAYNLYGGEGK